MKKLFYTLLFAASTFAFGQTVPQSVQQLPGTYTNNGFFLRDGTKNMAKNSTGLTYDPSTKTMIVTGTSGSVSTESGSAVRSIYTVASTGDYYTMVATSSGFDILFNDASPGGGFFRYDSLTESIQLNKPLTTNSQIQSTVSTGTAPFVVASTTQVANLNAATAGSATTATTATNATNTAITDDTSTNATMYPTWVTAATGNLPQKVSSTKMTFNPSTGLLSTTAVATGTGGSVGGYAAFGQGTATTAPTSSVGFMAPTSVSTKFMMTLPAAPATGFLLNTGTSDPSTISFVAGTGSGSVVQGTSPAFTTNFTLANSASPTTSSVAQTAFDTDAWAASRGAAQIYDGTASTYVVAALASDTPTNGQVPTWNTGGTITWETPSAGGGSPGGSGTEIQYRGGASTFSAVTNSSVSGGAITLGNAEALGTTPTAYCIVRNTTAAAAGAQQVSPSFNWLGQGWKTNATAASQEVGFRAYVLPVQGAANPTATWTLQSSINGGAYTDRLTVDSVGTLTANTLSSSGFTPTSSGTTVTSGSSGGFNWNGNKSYIKSSADGAIQATNNAGTASATVTMSTLVSAKASSPYTVLATDGRTLFTNEGASAQITFNLPTAVANYSYTFYVQDSDGILIVASSGDTIRFGGTVTASGGDISSTTVGSSITLTAINATEWVATSVVGTWAD